MTTKFYSVHVEVGGYSWDVTGNDQPHDATAVYGLADPLVIGQRWPDSNLQPNVQPEPAEATVTIIAPNSTTYPQLSVGDPVAVEFYPNSTATGNLASFYGRVATITARPHELGVLYSLGCFDYTTDLQQATVGLFDYPAERITARIDRMTDEAFLPRIGAFPLPVFLSDYNSVAPRKASVTSLWDALMPMVHVASPGNLTELGTAQTVSNSRGNVLPQLFQRITNRRLDPTSPFLWRTTVASSRAMAYSLPLRLATVGGLLSATASAANTSPATRSHILDAGNVDFDTTFTQTKGSGVISQVTVQGKGVTFFPLSTTRDWANFAGGVASTVDDPVAPFPVATTNLSVTVDTDLFDSPTLVDHDGDMLATVLMDPNRPDPKIMFDVGTLTWQAWNEAPDWIIPGLGDLLTVARVATGKSPTNREWIVGVVTSWQLTVANGRPVVTLETMQSTNDPKLASQQQGSSLGPVRFDSPILGTTTLAQISTRDTMLDYELVRGS